MAQTCRNDRVSLSKSQKLWVSQLVLGVVGIAVLFVAETMWIPRFIEEIVLLYPETALLRVPSMFWQAVVVSCWQVAWIAGLAAARPSSEGETSRTGWRRVRTVLLAVAGGLILAGDISLCLMGFGAPGFVYAMLGAALVSFALSYLLR